MRTILQILAILACNLLFLNWFKYAFALGEYRIGGGALSTGDMFLYGGWLALIAACLVVIGWTARRWPLLQPALAMMYLFFVLIRNEGWSDWPSMALAFTVVYCVALTIACGAFAIRRRRTRADRELNATPGVKA